MMLWIIIINYISNGQERKEEKAHWHFVCLIKREHFWFDNILFVGQCEQVKNVLKMYKDQQHCPIASSLENQTFD